MDNEEKKPKTGGRQAGTLNKRTQAVIEQMEGENYNPIKSMIKVARWAEDLMDDDTKDFATRKESAAIAGNMGKELAKYFAPQIKAVEISGPDGGAISNNYTWLPPEAPDAIPMVTEGLSMDDLDDEEEDDDSE